MRTSARSFASRLAALEQLEQQAEAETLANADIPDVAALDDSTVVWETTLAIRHGSIYVDLRFDHLTLATVPHRDARWDAFYEALAERVQPILDAVEKPIIFLASWEVEHAIAAIDTGGCSLEMAYARRQNDMIPWGAALSVKGQWTDDVVIDEDLRDTLQAVRKAYELEQRQLHYPQPRDFSKPGMTTLAEWRAWLVSVGGGTDATSNRV